MMNVLELLRRFRQQTTEDRQAKSEDAEVQAALAMTAEEFSRQHLAILIRSYLLGEDIYLVSNDECLQSAEGGPVCYLPEELAAIYHLSSESMRRIHNIKKQFSGEIVGVKAKTIA